ncbi:hypothetical protein DPMN_096944, partial [Dreissena polymorpha]
MKGNFTPADIIIIIITVNPVLEAMLHAALQHRENRFSLYSSARDLKPRPEFIPWTSTTGTSGTRTILLKQIQLTHQSGIAECRDVETRSQLFQQVMGLSDVILEGYTAQIASLVDNPDMAEYRSQLQDQFAQQRRALIAPFLENDQFERAGSLAEKYCDFEMLIRVCEATGNQDRVQRYQTQFADKGFSDFLFSWYMKEGKQGRLLTLPIPQHTQLQSFLQKDEFGYLKWLHDIECKNYREAHTTLLNLGRNEETYLAKKKTLLSLSKLAALAYGDDDDEINANIRDINEEQELILNQELLPVELLEQMNVDAEHMKVLSPVELIQLYICDENLTATEYDFKKALDLMQFIDAEDPAIDYDDIRTSIWCRSILRDKASWTHTPTGDPLDSVRDTIFFKTVSLAITDGWEPQQFLPDIHLLLSSEILGGLGTNKQLQFLLRAVYELTQTISEPYYGLVQCGGGLVRSSQISEPYYGLVQCGGGLVRSSQISEPYYGLVQCGGWSGLVRFPSRTTDSYNAGGGGLVRLSQISEPYYRLVQCGGWWSGLVRFPSRTTDSYNAGGGGLVRFSQISEPYYGLVQFGGGLVRFSQISEPYYGLLQCGGGL